MYTFTHTHTHTHIHILLPSRSQELVKDFVKFIELVETTIDLDMVAHHEFVIKPSFDESLARKIDTCPY